MSMDDLELNYLLTETNYHDASLNLESPQSTLYEATTNTSILDSSVTSFSIDQATDSESYHIVSNRRFATMPTPSLHPSNTVDNNSISAQGATSCLMDLPASFISGQSLQTIEQPNLLFANQNHHMNYEMENLVAPLPNPDPSSEIATTHFANQNLFFYQPPPPPPPSYSFNIEHQAFHTQTSGLGYNLPIELSHNQRSNSNFSNGIRDIFSENQEALTSFLNGKVRPGPDVARIYKCDECGAEFPTAQAFGGHMTAHNYAKRSKNPVEAEGSKGKKNKHSHKKKGAQKKLVINDENV